MSGKLEGVVVIDLTRVLAGPLAGQMLADLGAEVIKVEQPGAGDESRRYGPPFSGDDAAAGGSSFFLAANRNKKSVTVDFSRPAGRQLVHDLVRNADVVLENFRAGTLARHGLDAATLRGLNPRLVYCSITGFGQSGPYAQRPGYDAIFQAMGGLMSSIGYPDGQPNGGPLRTGLSITDVITSLYADVAVIAALYARDARGGSGEHIDMALLDCTVAAMSHVAMHYLISGTQPPRRGNAGNGGVPSQVFTCSDGALMLTVGNDAQFRRFCTALSIPELVADERFATGVQRIRNRDELVLLLEARFRTASVAHWLERLIAADIPAGPIHDMAAVFADPQAVHRGLRQAATGSSFSALDVVANPIHFADEPVMTYEAPPLVGQHTEEVLIRRLGLDAERLQALRAGGVI
jgi:crotonobetainyl-CoA:carnitine CoA-transferase CaiB-like acyl-CoA transferase